MDYFQLQEAVFNHLWQKHQQNNSFTFSVRQKASKGAEKNHFIGKEKSGYFSLTCWNIPVYYPGSSGDLTGFIFEQEGIRYKLKFQYFMSKYAQGPQNNANIALGTTLLQTFLAAGITPQQNASHNKMLYFHIQLNGKGYNNPSELFEGFDELYNMVAPCMDAAVAEVKRNFPDWRASRFTESEFNILIKKMHQRIDKYKNASPQELASLPEEDEEDNTPVFNIQHPLNTVLYGPPGTGKTYNTINKALAIASPGYVFEGKTRKQAKQDYDALVQQGQIEFVTFHQSMSYEDFIEGIKPLKPVAGEEGLKYDVLPGIFKRLVQRAMYVPDVKTSSIFISEQDYERAAFYNLGFDLSITTDKVNYRYCIDNNCIVLDAADGIDFTGLNDNEIRQKVKAELDGLSPVQVIKFVNHLKISDYVIVSDGTDYCVAIGKVTSDYRFQPNDQITPDHFRSVEWLATDVQIPNQELYQSAFSAGIERLDKNEIKKDFFTKKSVAVTPALQRKKYVLIIDEINRGNVSQIFGELITLIEEDKRAGKDEALTVTLPYSKKPFSVPDNLYIIGTMNTADRSVEALDTALRRRFTFEEMAPKEILLHPHEIIARFWNKKDINSSHTKNGNRSLTGLLHYQSMIYLELILLLKIASEILQTNMMYGTRKILLHLLMTSLPVYG